MYEFPVNEIVSFIEDFASIKIQKLREQFPESQNLLKSGQELGDSEQSSLYVKMEICKSGLELIIEKCKNIMPPLKSKIGKLSNIQLFGQIVTILSSAAIFTILTKDGYDWIKYITSTLVLAGSILSIFVQHRTNATYNNSSLFSLYSSLNDYYLQAEQQLIELKIMLNSPDKDTANLDELKEIIQNTNLTCIQIRKLIANYL